MIKEWYRFKLPVTSVHITKEGIHTKLTIRINGKTSGTLIADENEIRSILLVLKEEIPYAVTMLTLNKKIKRIMYGEPEGDIKQLVSESSEVMEFSDFLKKYDEN